MARACPVTTKWKAVGKMDTAPWVWVVVAVVVVVLVVLLLLAGGRRRKAMQQKREQEHREKAAEIRREAENMEIDAREREAKAIRARADAEQAQVDAARLQKEAEQRSQEAQALRGDVASHTRKADELDPDVGRDGSRVGGRGDLDHRAHHEASDGRGPARAGQPEAVRDAGYVGNGHGDEGRLRAEHPNVEHSDVTAGHGTHREASAEAANPDIPVAESEGRRRRADAGEASAEGRVAERDVTEHNAAERDVRGEGNPRP